MDSIVQIISDLSGDSRGLILLAASYLLGAVPFGYILTRVFLGYDIRSQGSGNIGMTNVIRTGGKIPGIATFLLDFGKGTLAVFLAMTFHGGMDIILLCAFLAVFGHTRPIYLLFRGGKGVATNLGVWVILDWRVFLVIAGCWILVFLKTKISSLAALVSLVALPIAAYGFNGWSPITLLSLFLSGYIIFKHHDNIRRILKGEEKNLHSKA